MKKRILSMVLALTMVMGILTGCGADSDGSASGSTGGFGTKEITVSEMLNSIIEENGEVEMYKFEPNFKILNRDYENLNDYLLKEKIRADVVYSDGKTCRSHWYDNKTYTTMSEFLADPSMYISKKYTEKSYKITLFTDVNNEILREKVTELSFGDFERIELDGESYMLFTTYGFGLDDGALCDMDCVMIKDTDYTKDKIVVFDAVGSDGIDVEADDYIVKIVTYDKNWTPNK